jgi:hypothetical protein
MMAAQVPAGYADEVAKFRKEREERLRESLVLLVSMAR